MNFIDNVDFTAATGRYKLDRLTNLSDLLDAVIAGPINLKDVNRRALRNLNALITNATWVDRWTFRAVQRLSKDSGARRLTDAPTSSKKQGVSNSVEFERVFFRVFVT